MDYENNTNVAPATSSLILEERHDSELFRVYALILDGITDHLLLPGKKLTESELCARQNCRFAAQPRRICPCAGLERNERRVQHAYRNGKHDFERPH